MCDECTWHHNTFLMQLYWHLAIQLYCIVTQVPSFLPPTTIYNLLRPISYPPLFMSILCIFLPFNFLRGQGGSEWPFWTITPLLPVPGYRKMYYPRMGIRIVHRTHAQTRAAITALISIEMKWPSRTSPLFSLLFAAPLLVSFKREVPLYCHI